MRVLLATLGVAVAVSLPLYGDPASGAAQPRVAMEALNRLESGDDPDKIEEELGDRLEAEDPFIMPGKTGQMRAKRRPSPHRDATLYEM